MTDASAVFRTVGNLRAGAAILNKISSDTMAAKILKLADDLETVALGLEALEAKFGPLPERCAAYRVH
jgi:hypothetical protein